MSVRQHFLLGVSKRTLLSAYGWCHVDSNGGCLVSLALLALVRPAHGIIHRHTPHTV